MPLQEWSTLSRVWFDRISPAAFLLIGGCSLRVVDYSACRSDEECKVFDNDFFCSADGFCTELREGEGLCEGAIEVRMLASLSGPVDGRDVFKGQLDFVRELNDQGGIRGCPIQFKYADYGYDTTAARNLYETWKAEPSWDDVAAFFGFGTPDGIELGPELTQEQKVLLSAGSYAAVFTTPTALDLGIDVPSINQAFEPFEVTVPKSSPGYPFSFFAGTDYSTGGRAGMAFVNRQAGRKVAFFGCTNAFCQGPLAAIKTYARDELGLELGRDLVIELTDDATTIDAKVLAFFEEERAYQADHPEYVLPDWIWIANDFSTGSLIGSAVGKVRETQGLDVRCIANVTVFHEDFVRFCQGRCIDYFYAMTPFASYGENVPGMADVMRIHDKWRTVDAAGWNDNPPEVDEAGDPLTYRNVRYVQGYAAMLLWTQAMERLIDVGKEISGRELRNVLESFDNVNMLGITQPLSFTAADHRPQMTERFYAFRADGVPVLIPPEQSVFALDEWLGW